MFLRLLILLFGKLKKASKFSAYSAISGSQIIVGISGLLLGRNFPASLTSLDAAIFASNEN
jgi:hypothetical protein